MSGYPGWNGPPNGYPGNSGPPGGPGVPPPPAGGGYPGGPPPGGAPGTPGGYGGGYGTGGYGPGTGPGGYGTGGFGGPTAPYGGGPGGPPGGNPKRTAVIAAVAGVVVVAIIAVVVVVFALGGDDTKDEADKGPTTSPSPSASARANPVALPATVRGMSPLAESRYPETLKTTMGKVREMFGLAFDNVRPQVYVAGNRAVLVTVADKGTEAPTAWIDAYTSPPTMTEATVTTTLPGKLRCWNVKTNSSADCFWGDDKHIVYVSDSEGLEKAKATIEAIAQGRPA